MKNRKSIFTAIIALLVLMIGVSYTAEAQTVSLNFGKMFNKENKKKKGQTYTTEELEDMVEWTDKESINVIREYEESLPCMGFKKEHPEFKGAKVGGIGLLHNKWKEYSDGYGMRYWVVYELTDGRNIVTFCRAFKKWTHGDVTQRDDIDYDCTTHLGYKFHEVSDWQREQ